MLQHSIFDEIAFRDHLLVSCNDGLLVFRPEAIKPELSNGVLREIAHWALSIQTPGTASKRPLVLLHVSGELKDITKQQRYARSLSETVGAGLRTALGGRYGAKDSQIIWDRFVVAGDSAASFEEELSDHLKRLGVSNLQSIFESAVRSAATTSISALFGIDAGAANFAQHVLVSSEQDALSSSSMDAIAAALRPKTPAETREANHAFIDELAAAWGVGSARELLIWMSQAMKRVPKSADSKRR